MQIQNQRYSICKSIISRTLTGRINKQYVTPSQLYRSELMKDIKSTSYNLDNSHLQVGNKKIISIIDQIKQNNISIINIEDKINSSLFFRELLTLFEQGFGMEKKKDKFEEDGKPIHEMRLDTLPTLQKEWSRNGLSDLHAHSEDSYDPYGVDVFAVFFLKNDIQLPLKLTPAKECIQLLLNLHPDTQFQNEFNLKIKAEDCKAQEFWNYLTVQEKLNCLSQINFKHQSGYNVNNQQQIESPFLFVDNLNELKSNWNCNENRTIHIDTSLRSRYTWTMIQQSIMLVSQQKAISMTDSNKIVIFPNHLFFHGRNKASEDQIKMLKSGAERILVRSKLKLPISFKK